jgi:hypothetical protein
MDRSEDFDDECGEKICSISGSGDEADLELLRKLVKNSRYVCSTCGRSAFNADSLCSPENI